jgi:hypothetical protein
MQPEVLKVMRSIRTLSVTSEVNDWLAKTRHPGILHVFDDVCNLVNDERRVLSIVTPRIGNGPFNLVVENQLLFSENLQVGSPVSILGTRLILGDFTLHPAEAKCWSPFPDWQRLHNNRLHIAGQCIALPIPYSQIQNTLRGGLTFAFANGDLSASTSIAVKLAGLGVGLTPAGDDFMLGALYAVWMIHPQQTAMWLANTVVNATVPLTTTLSAAWLRAAGRGEAGIAWHEFFSALIHGNSMQIQLTMNKILATGATSGAEALAGFIGTFISYAEFEAELCRS